MLALVIGLAGLLFVTAPATGVPEPIELEWQAPTSCPSEAQVLERLLAESPLIASTTLRVRATIEIRDAEFVVTLALTNSDGESERSFISNDCAMLTDAIVLAVGVALEESAVIFANEQPEPEPEPESEPEPEPEPDIVKTLRLEFQLEPEPEPEPRRPRVGLRAFGGGGYSPTRAGYGNVGGALALLGDRWRWELGGSWSTPRVVRAEPGIRTRLDAWALATRGCFVPIAANVIEFPLCAGIEAGQVRGRGLDPLPVTRRASIAWVAPTLAQGLWWAPIERLAIGIELELLVPLTRGRFTVGDVEVDRIAAVGLRGLAGIEVRLP